MKQLSPTGLILALVLFLVPATGTSQAAFLVRDINEGQVFFRGSHPAQFHAALGKVFFTARVLTSTWGGLWVTDGTDSGTRLLACPGACPAAWYFVGTVPGALLAAATPDGAELRLWRTDGTAPGTFPLTGPELGVELATEDVHRDETNRLLHQGRVYFSGCEPGFGGACGLWKTDGTSAGTVLVKLTGGAPARLTSFGGRIAFRSGDALWISDGTAEGTSAVKTFPERRIERIAAVAGKLFLVVSGPHGQELWTSNGTEAGTRSVKTAVWDWLKAGERGVYFLARGSSQPNQLWFSDGTPGGTRPVTDLRVDRPENLEEVGGRTVFLSRENSPTPVLWAATADPRSSLPLLGSQAFLDEPLYKVGGHVLLVVEDQNGRELWTTDGTRAGTRRLLEICPGRCHGFLQSHFLWPGGLLFTGRDDQNGDELWTSDGTVQGTRRLTSLPESHAPDSGSVPGATFLGNRVFFAASSGSDTELWVSEGPDDTRMVTNIAGDGGGSDPRDLVPAAGRLFFTACEGVERTVWQTTGAREGTTSLGAGAACGHREEPGDLVAVGAQVFFRKEDGELWRTDGTPGGTLRLATSVHGFAPLQDRLFFVVWTGGQAALWKTDGTQPGTLKVLDIPQAGDLFELVAAGSELYFAVTDPDLFDSRIWRSDGTPAGTRQVGIMEGTDIVGFVRAGPWVYFFDTQDHRIWKTDGTEAGTSPLVPLGEDYDDPGSLTAHGGLLYFLSNDVDKRALWRSDGTAAGTLPIKTFAPAPYSNRPLPDDLTSFDGRLAFTAYDPVHGVEPWLSDGTSGGTVLLKDILPGDKSSWPEEFTAAGGRLFFAASDGTHGSEPWQSDGTEAGTRMVQDISPFARPSSPADLTAAGNRLYFTADDGVTGRELWALPLTETGCQPSPDHLCLSNGRFQVEASWRDFQGNQGTGKAMALTADTGYFWFFSPSNVEVIVKVLDGSGLNGHRWVFYGALSSVEYTLTVTDTQTGLTRRYFNPPGQLASVGDTTSFGPLGAFSTVATGPCEPTAERLCLNNQRFAVEIAWKDFQGNQGKGKAVHLTADTGYFWFFDAANVEVMLKVLDGTGLNGKHWVFYGALSSVEYTITVTDTQTGAQRIYENPSGRLASVADTEAF